jgi:hypothetical protein
MDQSYFLAASLADQSDIEGPRWAIDARELPALFPNVPANRRDGLFQVQRYTQAEFPSGKKSDASP